jgi:hypothetical protein
LFTARQDFIVLKESSTKNLKPLVQTGETLLANLEELFHPKGDPMKLGQWTNKLLSHLVKEEATPGHRSKKSALAELRHKHRFVATFKREPIKNSAYAFAFLSVT